MITRCVNAECDEVTLITALGTLVDACEELNLTLEFGVEQDPICSVNFQSADNGYLFTGTDSAEMSVLVCAFFLCCYIRSQDEQGDFTDLDGSWRRTVTRFALMSFHDLKKLLAYAVVGNFDDEDALHVLKCAIEEVTYDS